jgi:hypothetical protein
MSAKLLLPVAACLGLLSVATPVSADPERGKLEGWYRVEAFSTQSFTERFRGGETTRIQLSGDGDTKLELRVYDAAGRLVASDALGSGDDRVVFVTPRLTGTYTVKVTNRGGVFNDYWLRMD